MDRRTLQQEARIAAGRCPRCGGERDRIGRVCTRCNDRVLAVNRQRYRPGRPATAWTQSLLAHGAALELRGWL